MLFFQLMRMKKLFFWVGRLFFNVFHDSVVKMPCCLTNVGAITLPTLQFLYERRQLGTTSLFLKKLLVYVVWKTMFNLWLTESKALTSRANLQSCSGHCLENDIEWNSCLVFLLFEVLVLKFASPIVDEILFINTGW